MGVGFNGFDQLNSSKETNGRHSSTTEPSSLSVTSPRVLMALTSLPSSSVTISSTWDSLYIYISSTKDNHPLSLCTGRWSDTVHKARKSFQEREEIVEILETQHGHLILHTCTKRLLMITTSPNGAVVVEESTDNWTQKILKMVCLNKEKIYSLLVTGAVYERVFGTQGAYKMKASVELPVGGHSVSDLACGVNHCLLLTSNGTILSFGLGTRGQLGHGDIKSRDVPCVIHALTGLPMTSIACGNWHCLVLSQTGDMYSWGWNEDSQLGLRTPPGPTVTLPTLVDAVCSDSEEVNFVSVSCGSRHSAAVSEDGILYCWGWNGYGQVVKRDEVGNHRVQSVYCGRWCTLYSIVNHP